MNSPDSLSKKQNNLINLILKNWSELDESQKSILNRIWRVITFKWQLQILFNLPFLFWWLLDLSSIKVHEFDLRLISYLNLPDWILTMIGFGQTVS